MIKWTQSDINYLVELFNDGIPLKEIAERLGRNPSSVNAKLSELYDNRILEPRGSGYKPKSVNDKSMTKESPTTSGNAVEQEQEPEVEGTSTSDYTTEPAKSQARWSVDVKYTCSACGWWIDMEFDMPYCPSCGAEMDVEE